jgi:hypothetical protein
MWVWLFLRAGFASFSSCMNSTDIVFCTRFVTIPFSHKLRLQIQLQSQYNIRQRSKCVFAWITARTLHALAASGYWRLLVLFTRCKLAGTSQLPVMRAQTFHANRIMEDATRFEVKPFEISITCMKRLWAHPTNVHVCKCISNDIFCEKNSTWWQQFIPYPRYIIRKLQLLLCVKISYWICRNCVTLCWVQSQNTFKFNVHLHLNFNKFRYI